VGPEKANVTDFENSYKIIANTSDNDNYFVVLIRKIQIYIREKIGG